LHDNFKREDGREKSKQLRLSKGKVLKKAMLDLNNSTGSGRMSVVNRLSPIRKSVKFVE
jgi:hypothetical protein